MRQSFARTSRDALTAFGAGFVGMLVQLVWVRILLHWFGASAVTIAAALAAALAGMAIGAFVFRKPDDGICASLELPAQCSGWLLLFAGIGVLEGLVLFVIGDWYLSILYALPKTLALIITATLALVPLHIALGGVLPTLVHTSRTSLGKVVGRVYAAETLGASAGALIAGFWLIQNYGLITTLIFAALTGILIGGTAVLASQSEGDKAVIDIEPNQKHDIVSAEAETWSVRLGMAVFLAGVASLGMEVVWERILILVVGTDTHSYTIVAVSYLVGVAIGAHVFGRFANPNSQSLFGWLQISVTLMSIISLILFCKFASDSNQTWLTSVSSGVSTTARRFLICVGMLIFPTFLIGASFPAAVSLFIRRGNSATASTGVAYALITLGNVVGVVISGFLLIPLFGLQRSLLIFACMALGSALLAVSRLRVRFLGAIGIVLTLATFHLQTAEPLGLDALPSGHQILFYREGPVNTVAVIAEPISSSGSNTPKRMVVDGIVIGENVGGVDEKQKMLAHLPMFLANMDKDIRSKPLNTISIGLGTGILAGEMAKYGEVGQVACVELSPAVIEAASHFAKDNHQVLSNKMFEIIQGDGIYFLSQSDDIFDWIVSDGKSRPGHAGNVAFFSLEYYELSHQRLTESGTFAQWISLDGSPAEILTICKTFAHTFEHTYLAVAAPDSAYLIGRRRPMIWDEMAGKQFLDKAASPLHSYRWRSPDDFKSMAWLNVKDIEAALDGTVKQNSLGLPTLERFAMEFDTVRPNRHKCQNLAQIASWLEDKRIALAPFETANTGSTELPTDIRAAALSVVKAELARINGKPDSLDEAFLHYREAIRKLPKLNRGCWLADELLQKAAQDATKISKSKRIQLLQRAATLTRGDLATQILIGNELTRLAAHDHAASCFYQATKLKPDNANHHIAFAKCLIAMKKYHAAIRPLRSALHLVPNHSIALEMLRQINDSSRSSIRGKTFHPPYLHELD